MGLVTHCERCKREMRPYTDWDAQPCRSCLQARIQELEKSLADARIALGVHSGKIKPPYDFTQGERDAIARAIREHEKAAKED